MLLLVFNGIMFKKPLPNGLQKDLQLLPSQRFIFLGLTLRSLIQFELTFVWHVRRGSKTILFLVDTQLSWYYLFKRLSFTIWVVLVSLLKSNSSHTYEFTSGFSIMLHFCIYFVPVPNYFENYSFRITIEIESMNPTTLFSRLVWLFGVTYKQVQILE